MEDAGKFGLRFQSQVGVGGVYSGTGGRESWDRQPLGAGQVERSQETWVLASVLPPLP